MGLAGLYAIQPGKPHGDRLAGLAKRIDHALAVSCQPTHFGVPMLEVLVKIQPSYAVVHREHPERHRCPHMRFNRTLK